MSTVCPSNYAFACSSMLCLHADHLLSFLLVLSSHSKLRTQRCIFTAMKIPKLKKLMPVKDRILSDWFYCWPISAKLKLGIQQHVNWVNMTDKVFWTWFKSFSFIGAPPLYVCFCPLCFELPAALTEEKCVFLWWQFVGFSAPPKQPAPTPKPHVGAEPTLVAFII